MTCECGYKGEERKMAFDVDEAYAYLKRHGVVYTIRPNFSKSYINFSPIHIHRNGKWTGEEGIKNSIAYGTGRKALEFMMRPEIVRESGFDSAEAWLNKLIELHGEEVTTKEWIIYWVELKKGQATLDGGSGLM